MRILMLTDDVVIDRRIIQEAQTLIDAGHEVILLATGSETLPEFEWIGKVKVERIRRDVLIPPSNRIIETILMGRVRSMVRRPGFIGKATRLMVRSAMYGLKVLSWTIQIPLANSVPTISLLPCERVMVGRVSLYNPDVVHAHDLPCLKVAVYIKRHFGIPLIYDAHELYPEINTLTRMRKFVLMRMEKHLIRCCDQVITVNPFIAEEMAKRYKIAEPAVVYNAVNRPEGFDPTDAPNRFRETMAISDDVGILLYQGWMSPTRGLQHLVGAMEHTDNSICLVMMGYGDAREELEHIVRRRGLAGKVRFKDAVEQDELLYWTSSADAGIIPYQPVDLNNYYCSPNKLFEFIQAGLPLIVNDLPFLKKVVGGENFGVVAKLETPEQYAQAIREMFDIAQGGPGRFRQRLLEQASEYNWTKEEKKIGDIYRQIQ